MPISFSEVRDTYHRESPWLKEAIEKIDKCLSDPQWVRDWKYGGKTSPTYWDIVIPGEATERDKKQITDLYKEVGWDTVVVTNSSENGERSGISSVKLYGEL